MKHIDALFDRMDDWRHFPNYQLERRADLFFSLYLPEVLERKLCFPIHEKIIPEFPIQSKIIDPTKLTDKSKKIDYVAISEDMTKAVFVELKTEMKSRKPQQDDYLKKAKKRVYRLYLKGYLKFSKTPRSVKNTFAFFRNLNAWAFFVSPRL